MNKFVGIGEGSRGVSQQSFLYRELGDEVRIVCIWFLWLITDFLFSILLFVCSICLWEDLSTVERVVADVFIKLFYAMFVLTNSIFCGD